MRAVLRNKNEVEKKKLRDLIKIYNQNHPDLSEADVLTGILPWHNLLLHQNTSGIYTRSNDSLVFSAFSNIYILFVLIVLLYMERLQYH